MARSGEGQDLIALIKEAVRDSGLSLNELARRSRISSAQLSRFMTGERSLTLDSAARLFEPLGLRVVRERPAAPLPEPPPPRPRRPRRKGD
jgi:transcriptional regulator with XRE-family HTH domain